MCRKPQAPPIRQASVISRARNPHPPTYPIDDSFSAFSGLHRQHRQQLRLVFTRSRARLLRPWTVVGAISEPPLSCYPRRRPSILEPWSPAQPFSRLSCSRPAIPNVGTLPKLNAELKVAGGPKQAER
ncbi:hypothetical protein CHU98_g10959 [Xylaria longipes]|nr:hypothetical protein CHU98_g10959 [Xylaria longipes]